MIKKLEGRRAIIIGGGGGIGVRQQSDHVPQHARVVAGDGGILLVRVQVLLRVGQRAHLVASPLHELARVEDLLPTVTAQHGHARVTGVTADTCHGWPHSHTRVTAQHGRAATQSAG